MKRHRLAIIAALTVVTFAGGVPSVIHAFDPADGDGIAYQGSYACPDLGQTPLFRSKGLEYVHTMAYAEALLVVAGGRSRFAPPPVPSGWQSAASNWIVHLLTHEAGLTPQWLMGILWPRFSSEENPCDPRLLYKASLEYRARPGNGNAPVLFPYYAPMAAHELEEMLRPLSGRVDRVATKIATAEGVGASECSPDKVARAKELLETARRATAEYHYDRVVIEPFYTLAERAAEELMEERRMAAANGFRCYSSN
ncbi:MAG: hypothetical protein OHK0028_09370 [Deltaproteobacteria bacterium]